MGGFFAALAVIVPIVELIVFALVADRVGVLPTVALLVVVSALGAFLLVKQGVGTLRRLRATLARREAPTEELADAALIAVAGLLFLTPGFFTDALAFLVVFPATRAFLRRWLRRGAGAVAASRLGWRGRTAVAGKKIYDVSATKRSTPGSGPRERPGQLPSPERPSDEDGSPDT